MDEKMKDELQALFKAFDEASMSNKKYLLGFAEGLTTAQMLKG